MPYYTVLLIQPMGMKDADLGQVRGHEIYYVDVVVCGKKPEVHIEWREAQPVLNYWFPEC